MNDDDDFGRELRRIRTKRGYSLAEVADQTGVSPSFLSLVETGKSDISIGRLRRLTEFYGIALSDLFPHAGSREVEAIRPRDHLPLPSEEGGADLAVVGSGVWHSFVPLLVVYPPGARMDESNEPTQFEGEAFVYVLEGTVGVEVDTKEAVVLSEGDAAYVRSFGRRSYWNAGKKTARLLAVLVRD